MTAFHRPAAPALVAPLVLSLGLGAATAQEFRLLGGGQFVEISGAIEEGAAHRFADFLHENPGLVGVRLNSPGGSALDAYRMADDISLRALSTYIAPDAVCASSCALMFFAGYDRLGEGALGVHRFDVVHGWWDLNDFLALVMQQAEEFDVPWSIRQHLLSTPPTDVHWITGDEFRYKGINRDLPGDARSHERDWPPPFDQTIGFAEYPATAPMSGKPVLQPFAIVKGREYESDIILEAASAGPNFAGHMLLVTRGCGTSCKYYFAADLRTGEQIGFPYGGEDNIMMTTEFYPSSRLIKVRWRGEDGCTQHDVVLEDREWRVLAETTFRAKNDYYCGG